MIYKLNRLTEVLKNNVFIILAFAMLSLMSAVLLLRANFVGYGWDMYFHLSRIWDIRASLINGNGLPNVALNKFHQSGSGAMTMYPYINLLPIVLLSFFTKSFIHLIYITFILRNFFALLIAFFASYSFNKNKTISFIFASSYTLSTMVLWYSFFGMDMGVTSALIYLPLVLFGTFRLLQSYKWKELAIGISGIMFSHVITLVLSILLSASIMLINIKLMKNKKFIISLIKAIVVTFLITSVFWIPFIIFSIMNKINMPMALFYLYGEDFNNFIGSIFGNQVSEFITITAFIGLILAIINYKKMTLSSKQMLYISIVIIVIASEFFPWNILNSTFIRSTFQRSWRVYPIAQLLLCYLFAENVVNLCKNRKEKIISFCLIVFAIICTQINGQKSIIDHFNHENYDFNHVIKDDGLLFSDYWQRKFFEAPGVHDATENREGIYGNNKHINMNLLGNGKFSFTLNKRTKILRMPFMIYNGVSYKIKLDGNNRKMNVNNNQQLELTHLKKGKHTVQVIVHKSWYNYLSYVLSALGVIILAFAWIRSLILKRKNKE